MSLLFFEQLLDEKNIKDLENGRLVEGDSEAPFSPPEDFDMSKFHRGRQFYRKHLFSCSVCMYFSLVLGLSIPEFLEVLVVTGESDTPEKALRRYSKTLHHIVLWHYGNVWEEGSKAQKSIREVRKMHKTVREQIQKKNKDLNNRMFITQYDMGVVMSGFMGAIIMYSEDMGIICSLDELDDYVYFWYGIGHLLGIVKKYNICAHGLSQALIFCKSIEHNIVQKNLSDPPSEFIHMAQTVVAAFQHRRRFMSILSFPVIIALCYDIMHSKSGKLSFGDNIRFIIWKLIFFTVRNVSWFRMFLGHRIESALQLTFVEV